MPRLKNSNKSSAEDIPPIRTGGRVKKAKIVFDPSENNLPKKRIRSVSVYVPFPYIDKTGDSPPKHKRNKPNIIERHYFDTDKQLDFIAESSKIPSTVESQVTDSCMVCGKIDGKRGRKLIPCKDCNYKVHTSCLKINFQNQNLLEEHWRCNNCRTCVVCFETCEAGILITCCVCVDAYHLNCHNPKLLSKTLNKLKWECSKCQNISQNVAMNKINVSNEEDSKHDSESNDTKDLNSPDNLLNNLKETLSNNNINKTDGYMTLNKGTTKEENMTNGNDEDIPDIADWSSDKVCKYIEKYFPEEAHIFRDQDIDGASLLLMKRSDVVRGMAIKLGPAIRLYSLIVKLQTKSSDPRLTWM